MNHVVTIGGILKVLGITIAATAAVLWLASTIIQKTWGSNG